MMHPKPLAPDQLHNYPHHRFQTTSLPAFTVHRYLGWDKEKNNFTVNEWNPNKEKYIIVDEVSMLDTIVTYSLLKGIKRNVKLILVGVNSIIVN